MEPMVSFRFGLVALLGAGLGCPIAALAASSDYKQCISSTLPAALRDASCSNVIATAGGDKVLLEKAHNARGLARVALNRYTEAVADFSEVIRLDPKIAGYYDNRRNAYGLMGELDYALSDAYAAVKLAPTYAFVFRARGLVFADMAQYPLAIDDFTTAITLDPADAGVYLERGKALVHQNRTVQGIEDFTAAIARDPNLVDAYKQRGLAYQRLGMPKEAIADLEKVQLLKPNDIETAQALQALR